MPRPRKFVEEDVIAAAVAVFVSEGYGGTTIEGLLKATGLGKQSLYNSFGGKRQLFLRALDASTTDVVSRMKETLNAPSATPMDRRPTRSRAPARKGFSMPSRPTASGSCSCSPST